MRTFVLMFAIMLLALTPAEAAGRMLRGMEAAQPWNTKWAAQWGKAMAHGVARWATTANTRSLLASGPLGASKLLEGPDWRKKVAVDILDVMQALETPPDVWWPALSSISTSLADLVNIHDPSFVRFEGESLEYHKHAAGMGATGLEVNPCLMRLGLVGAVAAPTLINIAPVAVAVGATGAAANPLSISVGRKLISGDVVRIHPTPGEVVITLPVDPGAAASDRAAMARAVTAELPGAAGYVPADRAALKRTHRQRGQLLCKRCQELSNGVLVEGVADERRHAAPDPARALATPAQLRAALATVAQRRALAVLLVDLTDAAGSFLSRVRDLVGRNPVLLLGTKADLLPQGTNEADVVRWLLATAAHKRLSPFGAYLVSSRTNEGVSEAVATIRKERRGRDVYVLGAANVGKSAFVRALMREMRTATSPQFDPAALAAARRLPVESAVPGTTLAPIPLRAFAAGGVLYDTPGVHLAHRLPHLLGPELARALHPRGPLRAFRAPAPAQLPTEAGAASAARPATGTYLWGGLARIDVLAAPAATELIFYSSEVMRVIAAPLPAGPSASAPAPADAAGQPLFGAEAVAAWGGLRVAREVSLDAGERGEGVADICVSGLPGWVAVWLPGARGLVQIRVWAPAGIEVFVRPPLPVPW
ncbi:hypothetical protein WJX81_000306 [Elliptochloris bilobata]|uniref:G domain-containing protein n=1 Tax=Elliptochloris bilobata TaxID=381761 RepID=A0AAW1S7M0_9CHLO